MKVIRNRYKTQKKALWCLTPLSTIHVFQLYRGGEFYWWTKPEFPEKTTDMTVSHSQTLSHYVVSSTPRLGEILTHNVSGDRY
jgi:hypothetical protein